MVVSLSAFLRFAVGLSATRSTALFPGSRLLKRAFPGGGGEKSSWVSAPKIGVGPPPRKAPPGSPAGGLFGATARGSRPGPSGQRFALASSSVLHRAAATTNRSAAARGGIDGDEALALRAALASLRMEMDALRVSHRELQERHGELRAELTAARRNATALATEMAKSERLKRRMQSEVHQLRDVAQTATSRALRVESTAKREANRRPAVAPPRGVEGAPPGATAPPSPSPEARAARLRERSLRSREKRARLLLERERKKKEEHGRPAPARAPAEARHEPVRRPPAGSESSRQGSAALMGTVKRGMSATEFRTPAPNLEASHGAPPPRAPRAAEKGPLQPAPSLLAPRAKAPVLVPEVVRRRTTWAPRSAPTRSFDSLPSKLSKGSSLYQQLQLEAFDKRKPRATPRDAPPRETRGIVLPFESDVWGFSPDPPPAPKRRTDDAAKVGTATILAKMAMGSDLYREARLKYVKERKAVQVSDDLAGGCLPV